MTHLLVGRMQDESPVIAPPLQLAGALPASTLTHRAPRSFPALPLAGALGLYVVGNRLVTRDRPPVPILDPGLVPDDSFPWGHVIAAVVVYGSTALLIVLAWSGVRRWMMLLQLVPLAVAVARTPGCPPPDLRPAIQASPGVVPP